jgi:hypothetical protein
MGTVLESARFFVEPEKLTCAICATRNPVKEACCEHCMAPLELSRSIAARGAPPRFLSVLGASGAGKTVYLGMLLDILSKGYRGLHGFANGPFSVAVQQETIAALQSQRFPELPAARSRTTASTWSPPTWPAKPSLWRWSSRAPSRRFGCW